MNKWIRYLDYFFVTRPILFFPGWATLLAGYLAAQNKITLSQLIHFRDFQIEPLPAQLLWGLAAFSLAMASSFILNQIRDVTSDKSNNKLFLLGDGHIPLKHGYTESLLLITASLIIGAKISCSFLGVIALFIFLTGYLYNYPPFSFKDEPLGGLFANMLMGWLAFAAGWTLSGSLNLALLLHSMPYLFFNTSLYFLTTLPDMKGDASSHKITFPVKYGFRTTIMVSSGCYFLAMILSLIINDGFLFIVLVLSGVFMLQLLMKKSTPAAIVAIKMGIFFFCLLLSFKFPFLLILIVPMFFLTRFYYKNRFGFDYPNFRGN